MHTTRPAGDSPYAKFSFLLKINTTLSAVACAVCWVYLPDLARWHALAPAALALAYTLPVLPGRRRLREVALLKIFLLCACWAWLTVMVPAADAGMGWSAVAPVMVLERAAFIFAMASVSSVREFFSFAFASVRPALISSPPSAFSTSLITVVIALPA
ncbi:MAG: hypothetical protein HUU01_19135 [Saprospiraceae bacterium]|nr:hypothetical protein [Saprospiraceae bacterium]